MKVLLILVFISLTFSFSLALAKTRQDRLSHREQKLRHELKKNLQK